MRGRTRATAVAVLGYTIVAVLLTGCGGNVLQSLQFPDNHLAPPNALYGIACPSSGHCIAVGAGGRIDVTLDGGAQWHVVAAHVPGRLLSIACTSSTNCVAVGDGGAIVTTGDGGAVWEKVTSHLTEEIDGVTCIEPETCLAVGSLGAVIKSTDGGATWSPSGSLDAELTSISCYEKLCAVASLRTGLDTPADVYSSDDDGTDWLAQYVDMDRNLFAVDCTSKKSCTVVGDSGAVDETNNWGTTWITSAVHEVGSLTAMACPSHRCLVGGAFGSIFASTRTGWIQVAPGNSPTATRQVIEGIACASRKACWAVGDQGTIAMSRNGGTSWKVQFVSPASGYTRVLLVGDSVAQTLGAEMPPLASHDRLYLDDEGILGCGIAEGEPVVAAGVTYTAVSEPCNGLASTPQWPTYWQQYVDQLRPAVAVMLAGYWEVTDRMHDGQMMNITEPAYQSYIEGQLQTAVNVLSSRGAKVVLLTSPYFDTGTYPEDDPARVDEYNALVRQVAAQNPNTVSVIDLNAFVDPGGQFASTIKGVTVRQSDGEHFTTQGSALIGKWLLPQLATLAK